MIEEWAYQRKMSFNSDRTKPAHEVTFSGKTKNTVTLIFTLTKCPLLKQHLKSAWDLTLMRSLRLTIT